MKRRYIIIFATIVCILYVKVSPLKAQEHVTINDLLLLYADSANYRKAYIALETGADPNASTWDGVTALMYASQSGSYLLVRELIARGADINAKPDYGNTALHSAIVANHDSIVELLILNGAEINAANSYGVTPLHNASAYGYPFLVDLLLYYGASIDSSDYYGNTPLLLSVYSGAITVAEILLEGWADVNKSDNNGYTPSMIAAHYNDTLLLRMLTDYGADIYQRTSDGVTALAFAIANRAEEAADFLISIGAAKDDFHPKTSYAQLAKENGLTNIYYNLAEKGSPVYQKPIIRSSSMQFGSVFNGNDFFVITGVKAHATSYGVSAGFDFYFRPYFKPVLVEEEDISFQFFERRFLISTSLEKFFYIKQLKKNRRLFFHIGADGFYSWGRYNYHNARTKPKKYLLISPSVGFSLQHKNIFIKTSTHLLMLDHLLEQSFVVKLSLGHTFNFAKPKIRQKTVPWY